MTLTTERLISAKNQAIAKYIEIRDKVFEIRNDHGNVCDFCRLMREIEKALFVNCKKCSVMKLCNAGDGGKVRGYRTVYTRISYYFDKLSEEIKIMLFELDRLKFAEDWEEVENS